jgi:hypothetical protein
MRSLLLSKDEQGLVIFHIWKSLSYGSRIILAIMAILFGGFLQYYAYINSLINEFLFPVGVLVLFFGNLLLLVKGYNNKIKLDKYSAEKEWVTVDEEQLERILKINRKTKAWDVSSLDITNVLGVFMFILVVGIFLLVGVSDLFVSHFARKIIIVNTIVLFVPHWFTGVRRITTTPKLVSKINLFKYLMSGYKQILKDHIINYLVYVEGENEMLPKDVKMKIKFKDQPENFLGLYAQISLNNVNDRDYPYFYVVLVANVQSDILEKVFDKIDTPLKVIKEYKTEGDIELIVIRQKTTKTSGYHTKPKAMVQIFDAGLKSYKLLQDKTIM